MCGGAGGGGSKGENEGVSQLEQVDHEEMENNILGTGLWALAGFSRNLQIGHRRWQSKCAAAAGGFEINSFDRVDVSFASAVGRRSFSFSLSSSAALIWTPWLLVI